MPPGSGDTACGVAFRTAEDVIPATRGFLRGYSFVRDREGTMYWSGGTRPSDEAATPTVVWRRRRGQEPERLAGGAASVRDGRGDAAGFEDIRWMTTAPDGAVWLVDGDRLRRVAPDGTVRTMAQDLRRRSLTSFTVQDRHLLMGLAVAADGTAYIARYGNRDVVRVEAGGRWRPFVTARAPWSPVGVALAHDMVYVLEEAAGSVRVRRFDTSGRGINWP